MAILVLTSCSGSPGVTTLAVGLALAWPRSVLLADCDPGAHQSVLAGFLAGQSPEGKGLLRVAEAHRDRRPLREVIIDQSLALSEGDGHSRTFLPGFSRPGSANLFAGVWNDLADALDRLDDAAIDVIIDAGRMSSTGLPPALIAHASLITLVMGSNLRSVVSARVHLPVLQEQTRLHGSDHGFGLVVVGPGQPYDGREISTALGVAVTSTIPDDPMPAAHLADGRARPRKFDTSPLAKALHTTADSLATQMRTSADLVRSGP